MAELFLHDSMTVEAGKTVFMHDSMSVITITTELEDIDNDFRMVLPPEELYDINNDFRMYGTFARIDINNDFRFADIDIDNINNDFRMVGEIIRSPILNDFRTKKEESFDINNEFRTVKLELKNINNKFNNCIEVVKNINNIFASVKEVVKDLDNDFRTKKETSYEVNNDFRMISPWQFPGAGEVGFQSAGKTEVKVYINSVEQTDVNVDSINWTENLNAPATASFNLARPYDSTKPDTNTTVEIKYKEILLYKGYITEVNPADSPESIRVSCQNEYWKLNKTKKYFFVGRKPVDTNEFYYETIEDALDGLGFSYNIGNFIPQTMDLYGSGTTDAISNLVQNSGNFSWFIKPDGTKMLWQAGEGNIIDLEPQQLGKNIGLYQVIRHNIRENISAIVNKLRVLMGNWTIVKSSGDTSKGSGYSTYTYINKIKYENWAIPAWDRKLEVLVKDSDSGYGYDKQDPEKDYTEVYRKFWIPEFETGWVQHGDHSESLTDIYPPLLKITRKSETPHFVGERFRPSYEESTEFIKEGFTIDYGYNQPLGDLPFGATGHEIGRPFVILSEPQYGLNYGVSWSTYLNTWVDIPEIESLRSNLIKLYLWKEYRFTYTGSSQSSPDEDPVEDEEYPFMFYTDKMGDYSETIINDLNLSSLSIQEGRIIKDKEGNIIENIPSWNDANFAKDYANWQLSKTCDKKYTGSINLTIDAMLYYNIDLSKRIKISGIVDPINIMSITYNFGNFTATLNLESHRYYKRSETIQYRGE